MIEYTVCQVLPGGTEDPLSSGRFIVGQDFAGVVLFPDEEKARAVAVEYAETLARLNEDRPFIVRRTETEIVWPEAGNDHGSMR